MARSKALLRTGSVGGTIRAGMFAVTFALTFGAVVNTASGAPSVSSPEGDPTGSSGSTGSSSSGTTATATPTPTAPEVNCVRMSWLANEGNADLGRPIVAGPGVASCMPDIKRRLLSAAGGAMAASCFDDFTTRTNDMECGELDDWMWYYWLSELTDSDGNDVYDLTGRDPSSWGGVSVAMNELPDGSCNFNGEQTRSGFCQAIADNFGSPTDNPNPRVGVSDGTTYSFTDVVMIAEPISLLWENADADQDRSVYALFPLDLSNPGRFYQWQASSAKPLLVYDPAHSGKITSAAQLFGNWTFGGKKLALADTGRASDAGSMGSGAPWRDGYEALASLDRNGDGKLTGSELEPLGLWFDENRDAVSQSGEVRPLSSTGVDVLSVNYDRKDSVTGDLIASAGYERKLANGARKVGASVDWMAKGYTSPEHIATFERGDTKSAIDSLPVSPVDYANDGIASAAFAPGVSGVWEWKVATIEGAKIKRPEQYHGLLLVKSVQGVLHGGTVVEVPVTGRDGRRGLMVNIFELTGHTEIGRGNALSLKFTVGMKDQGKTVNEARLVDAKHMEGVSKVEIGRDKSGRPLIMSYAWKAEKVDFPK